MSWKRSSSGTSIVSTSARWIASPSLRRNSAVLPLRSEIRTRGMALTAVVNREPARGAQLPGLRGQRREQPGELAPDFHVALAMRGAHDLLPQFGLLPDFLK